MSFLKKVKINWVRDDNGRIIGGHWRGFKPFWNKSWLISEYVLKHKSASQIAKENGCIENNILYFLKKFKIQTRSMKEIRKNKYWGLVGKQNGMYGRLGKLNPNWKGGISGERQSFYSTGKWKKIVTKIWKKTNGFCERCKRRATKTGDFHIHHIIPFEVVSKRCVLSNLVLLCIPCHRFVHSRKNRMMQFVERR